MSVASNIVTLSFSTCFLTGTASSSGDLSTASLPAIVVFAALTASASCGAYNRRQEPFHAKVLWAARLQELEITEVLVYPLTGGADGRTA
jgi:hypothetical protein